MNLGSGVIKGTPDILVMIEGGRFFWIEMKTKTGKQSPEQKIFEENCKMLDIKYYLSRNLDDTKKALNQELTKGNLK